MPNTIGLGRPRKHSAQTSRTPAGQRIDDGRMRFAFGELFMTESMRQQELLLAKVPDRPLGCLGRWPSRLVRAAITMLCVSIPTAAWAETRNMLQNSKTVLVKIGLLIVHSGGTYIGLQQPWARRCNKTCWKRQAACRYDA